jgi:phosphopentomutase
VGKIRDLFGGRGITTSHAAPGNREGLAVTGELLDELETGLVFVNLIDTDQLYAHRKDVHGFHVAPHTDHTREHVPLLAAGPGLAPRRHDGAMADVGATVHHWLTGAPLAGAEGASFL